MPSAKSYNIILGVTGSIAAYKAAELVRIFQKAGHNVRVVMSESAENFVAPLTFQSLTNHQVLRTLDSKTSGMAATAHIELAQWGHIFVIAPATANVMAKLANGIADDALTTEALAFQGPVLLAPAMNTRMWFSPLTQKNLETLQRFYFHFVGPDQGDLACGEVGTGKMSDPQKIAEAAFALLQHQMPLKNKNILVTSGPTRAYLDPVRFLTNRSSGRMGHSIALAAERLGAKVTLVTGPVEEKYRSLKSGKVVQVETGDQMLAACLAEIDVADAIFATAAVADFYLPNVPTQKVRREGNLQLNLMPAVDVLGTLGKKKKRGQVFFGFAAETGEGADQVNKAKEKLKKKNLDFLAMNNVSRTDIGFDVPENEVILFEANGLQHRLAKQSKNLLADHLVKKAFHLL